MSSCMYSLGQMETQTCPGPLGGLCRPSADAALPCPLWPGNCEKTPVSFLYTRDGIFSTLCNQSRFRNKLVAEAGTGLHNPDFET